MTLGQLIRVFARRWYVVVVVLIVTAFCAVLVARAPGVYSGQASVRLLTPPSGTGGQSAIGVSEPALVHFAALVEKEHNGNEDALRFAGQDATLAGVGVREGVSVRLANSGNQWNLDFREPLLLVDVVAPDAAQAQAMIDDTVTELVRTIEARQDERAVSRANRVGVLVSPAPITVSYVTGSRSRSIAATLLLGGAAAVLLPVVVDRIASRRGRRTAH